LQDDIIRIEASTDGNSYVRLLKVLRQRESLDGTPAVVIETTLVESAKGLRFSQKKML
jgi:hypothetical protein